MKKNLKKQALITTAAIAGVALVGQVNVHADATNNSNNGSSNSQIDQQQSPEVKQAQQNLTSATNNYSSVVADKNAAQSAANSASDAQSAAQQKADQQAAAVSRATANEQKAASNVKNDQTSVASAQAKVDEATPENINKAKNAISDQNQTISNDQTDIQNAQSAASAAQQNLSNKQNVAQQANEKLNGKKAAASEAQRQVEAASDALAGTHLVEAQNDYNQKSAAAANAQQAVNAKQSQVTDANNNVTSAQNALNTNKRQQSAASDVVSRAQQDVNSKSAAASTANAAKQTAQSLVDKTQKKIDRINDELNNFAENDIKVPAGAVDAYNAYETAFETWYRDKTPENKKASDQAADKMYQILFQGDYGEGLNKFNSSKFDEDQRVNVNNLTQDQMDELNAFTADMINKARKAWGTDKTAGLVKPTTGVINMANEIAQGYRTDNWSIAKGHNVSRISAAAGEMGLETGDNYYENAGEGYLWLNNTNGDTTMDALKGAIYNSITAMLFNDGQSGNGHMRALLGLMHEDGLETLPADQRVTYFGASVNTLPGSVMMQNHFILVPANDGLFNQYITNQAAFESADGEKSMNYVDPQTKLTQEKNQLTDDLTTQKSDLQAKTTAASAAENSLNNAKTTLATDQAALTNANNAVDSAQKALDSANSKLSTLNAEFSQLNSQLSAAKQAKIQAQRTLAAYTADHKSKLDNYNNALQALNEANKAVDEAQSALQNANNDVNTAKQTLNQKNNDVKAAQEKLTNDQNTLKELNNNLAALENAPKILKAAKDQLTKDQQALSAAQNELKHQKELQVQTINALADAKAATAKANDALAQATIKVNNASAALKQAQQVWATLHNDAHLYGSSTQVAPVTITAGDALPSKLSVQNGFIVNTPNVQILVAMPTSSNDSNAGKVPSGTYAVFANLAQAQKDAQTPGTYTEPVTIVFPDGSTYPYEGVANSTMRLTVLPKPVKKNTNNGTSQAQQEAQAGHYHIVNNTVVNGEGQSVTGWTVKNGQMVSPSGEIVSTEAASATQETSANNAQGSTVVPVSVGANGSVQPATASQNKANELPQTGDNNNENQILAFVGLALASVLTFLGINKRQHN